MSDSDWDIDELPERLRRFQRGVAEMLLDGRLVAYLTTKVLREGYWDDEVWVQGDDWTLQIHYARTDPTSPLDVADYISVSTGGGNVFGMAVTDLEPEALWEAIEAGWISFMDEPERERSIRYRLRWLADAERDAAWSTYGWTGAWPDW